MSSPITARLRSNPVSMALIAEPMRVTAMMPMITPSAVSIDRILCIRICSEAIRKLSIISLPTPRMTSPFSLLLDRHLRSVLQAAADGGVAPGHDLLARLHAALDLDVGGVGNSGLDFALLDFVTLFHEHDALQFLALLALFLLLEREIGDVGAVVAFLLRLALRARFFLFFRRLVALRAAHRDALNRDGHRVLDRAGLDVGGRAHARTQGDRAIGDANLHQEIRDLFLRAEIVRRRRAGDLAHDAGDLAVGISVDADLGDLADLHVDHVVLVDVDLRLHAAEVSDAHDFRSRELAGTDHALAEPRRQRADRAVGRRMNDGLAERVVDLLERAFGTLDGEQRRLQRGLRDVALRLR